jgi:hypothetical protein
LSMKPAMFLLVDLLSMLYVYVISVLAEPSFRRLASDCRSAMPGVNVSFSWCKQVDSVQNFANT